jgi:hypothetical protein
MITEKHPMTDVAFFSRALPLGKATRGTNFAPRVFDNITLVRTDRAVFEKEAGAGKDWVKRS